ncbi:MAG: hypothetical protein JWO35_792 [Candidatus Saccharibacteria bacterium]|nr:hypothetical protein [Candidatus Saccharibacteria bacterium]
MQEAHAVLQPYVPLVAQLTGKDTTLDRIVPLMELLGNPQDDLKIIHIAGTSGKTSTAYYMAALLQAASSRVGLTVSPHIDSVTERVQINGRAMTDDDFCTQLGIFLDIVEQLKQPPSYFELLYAFSVWVFARQQVDYAVIETGMGGLYDATNVATRPDKICVITDIGFDHMSVLGTSLADITKQKIGIVHQYNETFMYQQTSEVMTTIEKWVSDHHAPLTVTTQEIEATTSEQAAMLMPDYQKRNWLLARRVYQYIAERDGLPELSTELLQATQRLQVPARMDVKQIGQKTLIMDGAHNLQKMTAFLDSFRQQYRGTKPVVLVAFKAGKEFEPVIPLLSALASRIIITTFETTQDILAHSMDPNVLKQAFMDYSHEVAVDVIADNHEAYQELLKAEGATAVITGSFYLLAQIRNNEHIV